MSRAVKKRPTAEKSPSLSRGIRIYLPEYAAAVYKRRGVQKQDIRAFKIDIVAQQIGGNIPQVDKRYPGITLEQQRRNAASKGIAEQYKFPSLRVRILNGYQRLRPGEKDIVAVKVIKNLE